MVRQIDLSSAPRIGAAEAKRTAEREGYLSDAIVFVDVRDPDEYRQEHIAWARSIPLREIVRRAGELPRGPKIVTY